MKYMGSKARLSAKILEVMDVSGRDYVEPFTGGMNMIAAVDGANSRHANEINKYVVAMFEALVSGWVPPHITREDYSRLRMLMGDDHVIGWAGIACSYSGKWFGGYAGVVETKQGVRDYQKEALNNALKQAEKLQGVSFSSCCYRDLEIPDGSLVYCDPPHAGTTGYKDSFDSVSFWRWAKRTSRYCDVYVSEYTAPDFATEILSMPVKSSLSANGVSGGSKASVEKLFKL